MRFRRAAVFISELAAPAGRAFGEGAAGGIVTVPGERMLAQPSGSPLWVPQSTPWLLSPAMN